MEAPSTDHCSSPACWGCHGIRQRLSAGKGHSQYPEQCHPSLTGGGGSLYPPHALCSDCNQYRHFYPGGRSARAVHAFLPGGKIPEQVYRRLRLGAVSGQDDSGTAWVSVSGGKYGNGCGVYGGVLI